MIINENFKSIRLGQLSKKILQLQEEVAVLEREKLALSKGEITGRTERLYLVAQPAHTWFKTQEIDQDYEAADKSKVVDWFEKNPEITLATLCGTLHTQFFGGWHGDECCIYNHNFGNDQQPFDSAYDREYYPPFKL